MAMPLERRQDSIRYRSNAHLEGGAVLDELGRMVPYRLLLFARRWGSDLRQGLVVLDQPIELVDMDEAVAVYPWHVTVDLSDHDLRGVYSRSGHVDRDAEAAIATPIRRRHLNEGDVERPAPRTEQLRDLGEKARQVIDAIPIELVAHVVADEQVRHPK